MHLAEQIEEHWREEQAFHEKQHEEFRCAVREEREAKRGIQKVRSVEQQIADAEVQHRQFCKEHPELMNTKITTK